jgi:integral membrane protein (TIGR01906 family)
MKSFCKWVIWITTPIVVVMIAVTVLTTKPYLLLSGGLYETHDNLPFNYDFAVERIIGYLNYQYDDLEFGADEHDSSIIMRDTEISHMTDVKVTYTKLRIVSLVSLVCLVAAIIYLRRNSPNELYDGLRKVHRGPAIVMLFLGGAMVIDFDTTFTLFHKIFFRNNDWLLQADDVLILLVPQTFWLVSGLLVLVISFILFFAIWYINNKINKSAI